VPSVRARIVKRGLIRTLAVLRARSGGVPDPMGPVEELEQYALAIRNQMESFGARRPAPRGATSYEAQGTPVPGLWVVDDRARVRPGEDPIDTTDRVVLHLHGGAYCMGSPVTHRGLGAALSRTSRAAVLLPDYRLAPEHPFPAALDDVDATYRWLTRERGVDPARIAVVGDSAGGGLAAALLVRLRGDGEPMPACYVGLSPWLDLAGTGESMHELDEIDPWLSAAMVSPAARSYAGEHALDDPLVSPLYAELDGFPPVLVHVGSDEILRDDAVRFVAAARRDGVDASLGVFEGLWHVFQAFPGIPETGASLREVGAFIRRQTTGSPERTTA
jgi:epsilon-lactone hydrolase